MNPLNNNEKRILLITIIVFTVFIIIRLLHHSLLNYYNDSYYLLFHTIFEFFCIFVAFSVFLHGWVTSLCNRLQLGLIFLVVGSFNLMHTVYIIDVPIFQSEYTFPMTTWIELLSRFMLGVGLLVWVVFQREETTIENKQKNRRVILSIIVAVFSMYIIMIAAQHLPNLYGENMNVTTYKILISYCIVLFHLFTIFFILKRYANVKKEMDLHLFLCVVFLLISEITFTLSNQMVDVDNLLAHVFKAMGYFLFLKVVLKQEGKKVTEEEKEILKKWKLAEEQLIEQKKMASKLVIETLEEERKRVSRELHDGIGQSLYSIFISLRMLSQSKVDSEILNHIKEIEKLTNNTMSDVKSIAHDLRPSALDDLGLASSIRSHIRKYEDTFGIKIHFTINGRLKRLSSEIEVSIYRITQEALNNAAKYAETSVIYVMLTLEEQRIELGIRDEGKGFDIKEYMESNKEKGIGLYSMKERAYLLNGTIDIHSNIGQGTKIKVVIPILTKEESDLTTNAMDPISNKQDNLTL